MKRDWNMIFMKLTFFFVVILVVLLTYLLWLTYKPVEVYYDVTQPYIIQNEDKTVKIGGKVFIRQVYCKKGNYPSTITVILEDGYYETLRIIESSVEEGCYDRESRTAVIPYDTLPGKYRIRYRINVEVNPFRHELYEFTTEYFEVIE